MIKTDLQHLEELRDGARSTALVCQAEIELIEASMISMIRPDQQKERDHREVVVSGMKKQKAGHDKMTEQLDKMLTAYKKKDAVQTEKVPSHLSLPSNGLPKST